MFDEIKSFYTTVKRAFGTERETSEESIQTLMNRNLGTQFPLSIGTAQIFEAPDADIKKWHRVVLINLRTLMRNMYNAVPTEERDKLKSDDVLDALIEEVQLLTTLVKEYNPKCVAEFYLPDYSTIFRSFKKGNPRLMQTRKQREEMFLYQQVITRIHHRKGEKQLPFEFRESNWELERDNRETTLLTNFPTDLLSQYRFPKLNLLESHTGKVKERKEWYTKLSGDKEKNTHIPFNKFTVTVFGEGNLFLVSHRKVKQLVMGMASRDRWSYLTTESRIRGSIAKIPHVQDRNILNEYF